MKFGEVSVGEAEGAILAHSLKLGATALKKGRVLSRADLDAIAAAGLNRITVSLDSLDPVVFARMSGGFGGIEDVLDGI